MFYGVEADFGAGKTAFAVYTAMQLSGESTVIWSNVSLDKWKIKNVIEFPDDAFLTVLRTVSAINDLERLQWVTQLEGKLPDTSLLRKKWTRHIVIFDEAGAVMNGKNWKEFDTVMSNYVNQCRKQNADIILVTADGDQVLKDLRRFVVKWFYPQPFINLPWIKNLKEVRWCRKDPEGAMMTKKVWKKDAQGDWVAKDVPIDEHHCYFWAPKVWPFYDDLKKNIRDPERYNLVSDGFDGKAIILDYANRKGLPIARLLAAEEGRGLVQDKRE